MRIEVRHIDRTPLLEGPLINLIRKYAKTEKNILIVFDKRIKDCGTYMYNGDKKRHEIRISPEQQNKIFAQASPSPEEVEKYCIISTILHEIRHLQQWEERGVSFWNKDFSTNQEIQDKSISVEFSQCELDAKTYENEKLLDAVKYYNSITEKQ